MIKGKGKSLRKRKVEKKAGKGEEKKRQRIKKGTCAHVAMSETYIDGRGKRRADEGEETLKTTREEKGGGRT